LIEVADSRRSVELIAAVCSLSDWENICRQAGVEQAILRYGDGNLLLRGLFLETDSDWEGAISEAPVVKDVVFQVTESIYAAYLDYLGDNPDAEWQELAGLAAFGISMSVPHDYQPLLDHCGSPIVGLQEACLSIERQLQHEGSTLLTRAIGYAIQRERLKDIGEVETAERLERRGAALTEFSACVGRSTPDTFARAEFETWLELGVNEGELVAIQYLADEFGIDCELAAL
jgi:hypothetical protein